MPITWLNVYNTHIKKIDQQHRKLVEMINNLETARGKTYESKLVRELFFNLVDYTKYHFSEEESLMKELHYPKLTEHTGQHKEFINKIVEMLEAVKEGELEISGKLHIYYATIKNLQIFIKLYPGNLSLK